MAELSGEVVPAPPNPKSSHFDDLLGIAPFLVTGLDPMFLPAVGSVTRNERLSAELDASESPNG